MKYPETLQPVLNQILAHGGRPILVGGSVRDFLMHGEVESKDIDVEVFNISLEDLEKSLATFKVNAVGRTFGVLKVTVDQDTFDISLPRTESKSGNGHRGFIVEANKDLTFEEAASRRDFTINAIGFDPVTQTILDPYNGIQDIKDGCLRHVSTAFGEDPLRILRGCQFAARFQLVIIPATSEVCKALVPEMKDLSVERIWEEWKKLLLRSRKPSWGICALHHTGAIDLFPEIAALRGVLQDPEWHPEGDVFVHNNMVLDAAVQVLEDDQVEDEHERLVVLLGALCHDLGKPLTTEFKDGRWRAHDHETQGEQPTRDFLARIGAPPAVVEDVIPLVKNHLAPFHFFRDKAGFPAIRRLALRVPLVRLCRVARADFLGRTTADALACEDSRKIEAITWLMDRAKEVKVEAKGPTPILMGRHLIEKGHKPGAAMGVILKEAFEAQLEGEVSDLESALAWLSQRK